MTARAAKPWRAILDGEEAEQARSTVAEIAERLGCDRGELGHDLADGAAGVALLFGYLAAVESDATYRGLASALIEQAGEHVAAAPTSASLFHGFPGVAWAGDHVRALLGEPDVAINDDVDRAVAVRLGAEPGFDLVTGVVGLGVYGLERGGHPAEPLVEQVVARLAASARRVPEGVVWSNAEAPDVVDLGLAHGVPGVIAVLARCARRGGPVAETARGLMQAAVTWLLAQGSDGGGAFPSSVVGGRPSGPARLGWCYGDAAIAVALMAAAEVGDPAWAEAAIEIAGRAAERPVAETGVRDACLCHGAAALALIYQRLYHASGDGAMREAARGWLARIGEYPMEREARGLMNGAAGVGLVLLAASSDVAPDWDRALLLS